MRKIILALALVSPYACAMPIKAQTAPTPADTEAARADLEQGLTLRSPYMTGERNMYHPSKKPEGRFDVQVLAWTKMAQRLAKPAVVPSVEPVQRVTIEYASGRREVVE